MIDNEIELRKIEKEAGEDKFLLLRETAKNLVFGKGSPNAKIMFVGEAPGRQEDEQGFPFVGIAGKNLDKLLGKVGLNLEGVYIANILKYRPPENRNPNPEEIKMHVPYLLKQISIMKLNFFYRGGM